MITTYLTTSVLRCLAESPVLKGVAPAELYTKEIGNIMSRLPVMA